MQDSPGDIFLRFYIQPHRIRLQVCLVSAKSYVQPYERCAYGYIRSYTMDVLLHHKNLTVSLSKSEF